MHYAQPAVTLTAVIGNTFAQRTPLEQPLGAAAAIHLAATIGAGAPLLGLLGLPVSHQARFKACVGARFSARIGPVVDHSNRSAGWITGI
ncbi:MAG: hypothetical protein AAGG11_18950 [Pseudomonadota bacterium]